MSLSDLSQKGQDFYDAYYTRYVGCAEHKEGCRGSTSGNEACACGAYKPPWEDDRLIALFSAWVQNGMRDGAAFIRVAKIDADGKVSIYGHPVLRRCSCCGELA